MTSQDGLQGRLSAAAALPAARRIALLDEFLGECGPDEVGPACLCLLDLSIVPSDERPRSSAPRFIRMLGHLRRRSMANVHLSALRALVKRWERIPEDLRRVVMVAGHGRLAAAAEGLAESPDGTERASVCLLASASGEPSLAPVLVPLFADRETAVAAAAERALMKLSFLTAGIDPETGEPAPREDWNDEAPAADGRALVSTSVARVVGRAARERRRPVVLGAMALLDPPTLWRGRRGGDDPLVAWLLGDDEESRGAMRNALRWTEGALARRRALEWLSIEALGAAALERLSRARGVQEHEAVLSRAHLLAHPRRRKKIATLGRMGGGAEGAAPAWIPEREEMASLSRDARRGVARLLGMSGAGVEVRRRVLDPLLGDEDALVRHGCVRCGPRVTLADLCFDPDARIARSAALAWSLVGEKTGGRAHETRLALRPDRVRERVLLRLARSPHGAVRRIARTEVELVAWLNPHSPAGRACARRRLAREPEALIADLKQVLLHAEPEDRVAGVILVRHLSLHADFERELLALSEATGDGARARVAATAVLALGDLTSRDAAAAVARQVEAKDTRVRANAVEAAGRLAAAVPHQSALRSRLVELKDDAGHRARANALRGLLTRPPAFIESRDAGLRVYEPAAVSALLAMLADTRAEHRLAGAWLAGRLLPFEGATRLGPRWTEISVRVHELASEDPDARVRIRAGQCSTLLRARLKPGATAA